MPEHPYPAALRASAITRMAVAKAVVLTLQRYAKYFEPGHDISLDMDHDTGYLWICVWTSLSAEDAHTAMNSVDNSFDDEEYGIIRAAGVHRIIHFKRVEEE